MSKKLLLVIIYLTSSFLLSCKSAYEKQGDDHLKAGRYLQALQRYKYVKAKGKASKEFTGNLTRAYVGAMAEAAAKGADIPTLITYRDKIVKNLQTVASPAPKAFYAETAVDLAGKLILEDDFDHTNLAFSMLKDAEETGALTQELASKIQSIKGNYITAMLGEAESAYQNISNGQPEQGIVADYIMSKLALFVKPTAEINELWSKIRKANLSTYLMYDLEGLIHRPIPQINKYGVLMGITKMTRSGKSVSFQVKIFNGTTINLTYISKGFTLTDKEGSVYEPVRSRGAFSSKKPVLASTESGVAEVIFTVPKDIELSHLSFDSEAGLTVKYLP